MNPYPATLLFTLFVLGIHGVEQSELSRDALFGDSTSINHLVKLVQYRSISVNEEQLVLQEIGKRLRDSSVTFSQNVKRKFCFHVSKDGTDYEFVLNPGQYYFELFRKQRLQRSATGMQPHSVWIPAMNKQDKNHFIWLMVELNFKQVLDGPLQDLEVRWNLEDDPDSQFEAYDLKGCNTSIVPN